MPNERDALVVLAQRERRKPRDQAALIIRDELARRGLLAEPMPITAQPPRAEVEHERAAV